MELTNKQILLIQGSHDGLQFVGSDHLRMNSKIETKSEPSESCQQPANENNSAQEHNK